MKFLQILFMIAWSKSQIIYQMRLYFTIKHCFILTFSFVLRSTALLSNALSSLLTQMHLHFCEWKSEAGRSK